MLECLNCHSDFSAEEVFNLSELPEYVRIAINVAGTTLLICIWGSNSKLYANSHNLQVSRFMSPILLVLQKILKPLWNPLVSIGRRLDERIAKSAGEISVNELSKAVELTDNEERSVERKRS